MKSNYFELCAGFLLVCQYNFELAEFLPLKQNLDVLVSVWYSPFLCITCQRAQLDYINTVNSTAAWMCWIKKNEMNSLSEDARINVCSLNKDSVWRMLAQTFFLCVCDTWV